MSAVYTIFTSPDHPPVPDHLPTLIVTPSGKPSQVLYTYLHTNYNRENYLLTPSPQGDLCVAKLFPPPAASTSGRSNGKSSASEGHGSASSHSGSGNASRTVKCEASRNFRWSITNSGVLTPSYKCTLPGDDFGDGPGDEQPLFQISKTNPSSPFWTCWYYAYAGHLIPPKRIQFGHISKNIGPDGKPITGGGTRVTITGKSEDEKAVWKTLGEGNEDMVEWAVICAALHVLDDEIVKAAEAAGIRIGVMPGARLPPSNRDTPPPNTMPRPVLHPTGSQNKLEQSHAKPIVPIIRGPIPQGGQSGPPPRQQPPPQQQQQQQRQQQHQMGPPPQQQQQQQQQGMDPRMRGPPPGQQHPQQRPPQSHPQANGQPQQVFPPPRQPQSSMPMPMSPPFHPQQQQQQSPHPSEFQPPGQPRQRLQSKNGPRPAMSPVPMEQGRPSPHHMPGSTNMNGRPGPSPGPGPLSPNGNGMNGMMSPAFQHNMGNRPPPLAQQNYPLKSPPIGNGGPPGPHPNGSRAPLPNPHHQQGQPYPPQGRMPPGMMPPQNGGHMPPPRTAPRTAGSPAMRNRSPLPTPGSSAPDGRMYDMPSPPGASNGLPPASSVPSSLRAGPPGQSASHSAPPSRSGSAGPPPRPELEEEDTVDSVAFMLGTTALNSAAEGDKRESTGSATRGKFGRLIKNRS